MRIRNVSGRSLRQILCSALVILQEIESVNFNWEGMAKAFRLKYITQPNHPFLRNLRVTKKKFPLLTRFQDLFAHPRLTRLRFSPQRWKEHLTWRSEQGLNEMNLNHEIQNFTSYLSYWLWSGETNSLVVSILIARSQAWSKGRISIEIHIKCTS